MVEYHLNYCERRLVADYKKLNVSHLIHNKTLQCVAYSATTIYPFEGWKKGYGGCRDNVGKDIAEGCWEPNTPICTMEGSNPLVSQEKVIFGGFLSNVWGHALTDNFRKCWFLMSESCKALMNKGYGLAFVLIGGGKLSGYVIEFLSFIGIDLSDTNIIKNPTLFSEVLIPDDCFLAYEQKPVYTYEYVSIVERIRAQIPQVSSVPKKVYFSRTQLGQTTRDYGEERIEEIYRDLGFEVVYPEQKTVMEQLILAYNAEVFASTEGSISHIVQFCRPGTKFQLIQKATYINNYQVLINE